MPETIQIYVCADNCMRGVVLTAAEMNAADRFSYVIIEEDDLLNGNLEDITIEGVTDVLKKLERNQKQCSYLPCASTIFLAVILRWSMRNLTGVSRKLHLYAAIWIQSCKKLV